MPQAEQLIWPTDLLTRSEGEQHSVLFTIYSVVPTDRSIKYQIALPLSPDLFKTAYIARYEETNLGVGGAAVATAATAGVNGAGNFGGQSLSAAVSQFRNKVANGAAATRAAEAAVAVATSRNERGRIGGALVLGVVANPYQATIFQGTTFRPFSYSLNFVPRDPAEAVLMNRIIKAFKTSALPDLPGSGNSQLGAASALFRIPYEMEVQFNIYNAQEGTYWDVTREDYPYFRIGRSVIETINVDYNGSGSTLISTHQDGRPVSVNFQMSFKELEINTRQRIERNY